MWLAWPFTLTVWLPWRLCDLVGIGWPVGGRVMYPGSLRVIYGANSMTLGLSERSLGFLCASSDREGRRTRANTHIHWTRR
jgi:hypothetical protein